jgi:hypothetical protein
MVVGGTNIKLVDFGAAYLHREQDTQVGVVGSPLYMSPEQIMDRPLGQHSDMFSLGVVLYELLTGRRPFVGSTLADVVRAIVVRDPISPKALRPGLSEDVDSVLLRMLRKAPEERHPTWADLALDLAGVGQLSVYRYAIADREKFTALRKIALLKCLSDTEIWELAHAARWKRVPAKTTIIREGEPGQSLYLIGNGDVKITKAGRLLDVLCAGDYFGEMAYIKAGAIPRQATAESSTDVVLAEFEAGSLQKVTGSCQLPLAVALLHSLVDRLAFADARIVQTTS